MGLLGYVDVIIGTSTRKLEETRTVKLVDCLYRNVE
jgi:hypothetical protein